MELRIEHLTKRFKDKVAVNDVSITLTPGIWGLLGANGAGKSNFISFLEMIAYVSCGRFEDYLAKNGFARSILYFGQSNTRKLKGKLKFEKGEKKEQGGIAS